MLYCLESFKVSKRGLKKCNFCYKLICVQIVATYKIRNIRMDSKKSKGFLLLAIDLLGILLVGIPGRGFKPVFVVRINSFLDAHETSVIADFLHEP